MKISIFILLAVLFFACKSEKPCPYKPAAIFAQGLPHVVQYNFETQGPQSLESLYLDNGILLEIEQNVCQETQQEYRFTVKGDYASYPDSLWLKEAVRQLVFLSSFSERQAPLKAWADIIEERRNDMHLGQDREVQPGIFVRVDRVSNPDQSVLRLVFSQKQ